MKNVILPACLIAGTAVGAGMISLPMVLCKIGLIPTFGLILTIWALMYFATLIGAEINLRAKEGLPLGNLGQFYSGPIAAALGTASLMLLIYALLSAYFYGGASILQGCLSTSSQEIFSLKSLVGIYAFFLTILLLFPVTFILQVNRLLFSGLLIFFFFLIAGLMTKLDFQHLPWIGEHLYDRISWTEAVPLLSTSFGFQAVLHTLTNFCRQDPVLIRRSIFWGSLIPVVVYVLWTLGTLGVLYYQNPQAYQALQTGQLDVGHFIQILSQTTAWPIVQTLISVISIVAIIKSSIGLGLALKQAWQEQLNTNLILSEKNREILAIFLTIVPPLLTALYVPQLFLKALAFAGMISIVIAIFLPIWLLRQPKAQVLSVFYRVIDGWGIQILCILFGISVILCEVMNLIR